MPRIEGIFRQSRQNYNTKSVLRLGDEQVEGAPNNISSTIQKPVRKCIVTEMLKSEKKPYGRIYSRRKMQKLLRRLRSNAVSESRSTSVSQDEQRGESKMDLTNGVSSRIRREKISRCTSATCLFGLSQENSTITESFLCDSATSMYICQGTSETTFDGNQVPTNYFYKSQNMQTAIKTRNVALTAVVSKQVNEKGTQKTEKIIVKSKEDKATQMLDYFTLSDLYCVEWMHRNLVEIKLNPFHIVMDENVQESSVLTCYTSEY